MNNTEHEPALGKHTFRCPHCSKITQQHWRKNVLGRQQNFPDLPVSGYRVAVCQVCNEPNIWKRAFVSEHGSEDWIMVYPLATLAAKASAAMPQKVQELYEEARLISGCSPRAACALLRLALDELTVELKAKGKTLDDRIAAVVKMGVPPAIQRALDTTRVCGNDAVHPDQLVMEDRTEQARILFWCVNYITETLIHGHAELEQLYGAIPESKRKAIAKRDGKPSVEPIV